MSKYFKTNLKYLRNKNGIEQLELANMLGLKSASAVSEWEKGKKREHELGPLKTNNSYRTVPIPAAYIPGLKMYVNGCVKDMNNRIFIDKYNDTTSARLSYKFKKMGYDISVHDLRHTYVTILIKNGFDFKTIAELIGDTVEMVIKTYSHFTEDMFESAKDRINKIL